MLPCFDNVIPKILILLSSSLSRIKTFLVKEFFSVKEEEDDDVDGCRSKRGFFLLLVRLLSDRVDKHLSTVNCFVDY